MTETPRTEHTGDKRRQLLDAAERVYYSQRDLGLTVRRLAAEANTTSQTIYTYFGSRDAVVVAMYERATSDLERLVDCAVDHLAGSVDAGPAFVEVVAAYRRYCRRWPTRFLMLVSATSPEGTDPSRLEVLRKRTFQLVAEAIGRMRPDGEPAPVAEVLLAVTAINGFVQAEIDGFVATEEHGDHAFDHLTRTLVGTLA